MSKIKAKNGAIGGLAPLSQPEPLKITEHEIESLQACGFKLSRKEKRAAKALNRKKRAADGEPK